MWYSPKLGLFCSLTHSSHLYYHLGVAMRGPVHAMSSSFVKFSNIGVRGSDISLNCGDYSNKNAEVGVLPALINWLIDQGDSIFTSGSSL
jgi:hypothetical protein